MRRVRDAVSLKRYESASNNSSKARLEDSQPYRSKALQPPCSVYIEGYIWELLKSNQTSNHSPESIIRPKDICNYECLVRHE